MSVMWNCGDPGMSVMWKYQISRGVMCKVT